MTRPAPWKVLAFAAALTGLGMVGAGTAMAQTDALRESAVTVGSGVAMTKFDDFPFRTNDTSTSRSTNAVRGGSDSAGKSGKAGSDTSTSRSNDGSRIGAIHISR